MFDVAALRGKSATGKNLSGSLLESLKRRWGDAREPGAPSATGADSTSEGPVGSEDELHVRGELKGTFHLPDQVLFVEETGRVEGRATVARAVIGGTFTGDMEAGDRVTVTASGRFRGTLTCPHAVVEDGATINAAMNVG